MSFNINNYLSSLAYINKDFNSTWEEILDTVPKLTNKWVPREANESDPLVVLLKELGITTDKLNYNIDKNILETFPDLLTQLRAAYSIFQSMGYTPRWYRSATLNVTLTYSGGLGDQTVSTLENSLGLEFTIPRWTEICSDNSEVVYTLLQPSKWTVGTVGSQPLLAMEGTINDFEVNGSTIIDANCLDSQNRLYFTQSNVAENGIFISGDASFSNINIEEINYNPQATGEEMSPTSPSAWRRVTNLYQQLPGSRVFAFGIDPETGSNYIQFPDDIGNLIQDGIYIKYILSSGQSGNIKTKTLSKFFNSLSITPSVSGSQTLSQARQAEEAETKQVTDSNFLITNSLATLNGKDPETIAEMQYNYQRVVGTFNTLVTTRDYENYLYNQETQIGNPLVSNIRVSDRTSDLYASYRVKTMDPSGNVTTLEKQLEDQKLTAFELRFYPLTGVDSVSNEEKFNSTFNSASDSEMKRRLINAINQSKTVIHDFKDPMGAPLLLDYSLKGDIYLQKTVSQDEADEIFEKIKLAIYSNFNARELTFGQPIDYGTAVEVIKGADPRIQYVALQPIDYKINDDSLNLFNERSTLDLKKRAILNGNHPWKNYEDIINYWGSTGSSVYKNITSISPQRTTPTVTGNSYTLQPNETLYILSPGYTATDTYSAYLYMYWKRDGAASLVTISADSPYMLAEGETIYIHETRPEKGQETRNPAYTIPSGSIVKCSVDISSAESAKYRFNEVINMGSTITLSVLKKDTSDLVSTYPGVNKIKIATNSKGLKEVLESSSGGSYTLNIGEYLLWTNDTDPILEIGTVGEGNTISKEKDLPPNFSISVIAAGETAITWSKSIDNATLSYTANNIYRIGDGNTVTFDAEPWNKDNPYNPTAVFNLNGAVKEITYGTDGNKITIPQNVEGDCYKASLCLSLATSPEDLQKLEEGQQIMLTLGNGTTETISGKTIQSSSAILYSGGIPLTLSFSETESLKLQSLEGDNINTSQTFIAAVKDAEGNIIMPGISGTQIVFPAKFEEETTKVYYIVAKASTKLKDIKNSSGKSLAEVGPAKTIKKEEEISLSEEFKILGSDDLYDEDFDPLYQPSKEEYIENPDSAEGLLQGSHPCNKYALPRLVSLKDLRISSLSIKN